MDVEEEDREWAEAPIATNLIHLSVCNRMMTPLVDKPNSTLNAQNVVESRLSTIPQNVVVEPLMRDLRVLTVYDLSSPGVGEGGGGERGLANELMGESESRLSS